MSDKDQDKEETTDKQKKSGKQKKDLTQDEKIDILLSKIGHLAEFEKNATKIINDQSMAIMDLRKSLSGGSGGSLESVQSKQGSGGDEFSDQGGHYEGGSYIDAEGISWGEKPKSMSSGKKSSGKFDINDLKMYIPEIIRLGNNVVVALLQSRQNQGGITQVFQEYMLRNFMEDMAASKAQKMAMNNLLFKQGLIPQEVHDSLNTMNNIVNDPLMSHVKMLAEKSNKNLRK